MMDKINAAIKYSYCICIAESDSYLATCIVPIIVDINKRAMPKLSHGDTANKYVTSALCAHVCLIIDNIDYVSGIGNSSREQYIRADDPCRPDLQEKPQKCTKKITKNGSYCHARRDTVPKVVLYSVLWSKYGRDD